MGSSATRRTAAAAGLLALLTGASLLLRIGSLRTGYWIDEGISVGIASHGVHQIPELLRQDGSPPLYYLLLHAWMLVAGESEAATRALSLLMAVVAVPVAWWAGRAVAGARAGWLAAAGAAGCPFLTAYAQETRMYALVALLSLLASASFVLGFVQGRRRHLVLLGVWLELLLYTHTWAPFLVGGMALAWLGLWRRGRVPGRDGLLLGVAVLALYLPWVPTLLFQAAHTGAPWAARPSPLALLAAPAALFGVVGAPLLALAVVAAVRAGARVDDGVRALLWILGAGVLIAWAWSQLDPAWTRRYMAIFLGPLLLAVAALVARAPRLAAVPLAGVALCWLVAGAPAEKSDARAVAARAAPALRPGDVVLSTQPEQVPVLARYLPSGLRYATPLGRPRDVSVVDWRDALGRAHAHRALPHIPRGRRVLLVTPVWHGRAPTSPWLRLVRARSRHWRAALRADGRLRPALREPAVVPPGLRSAVRAELFVPRCSATCP